MTPGPTRQPVVAGALGFRDVGGLTAGEGTTRTGVLFRSGNLARLDDADREAMRSLGLRRIVDLRDDDEVAFEPSRVEGLGVQTLRAPLMLGSAASFFVDDLSLPQMYRRMIDESADRFVEIARVVVAHQPVLVHCTVGKDRTGVAVALMLAAAGVDVDEVVADYARTETLLPARRNTVVVAYLRRMHPEARHIEELATRSPAPVMRALLADIAARYGSAEGYLRQHGMDAGELAALRRALVTR